MPQFTSADFIALAPFLILSMGGLMLLLLEVFQDSEKRGYQSWYTAAVALAAAVASVPMLATDPHPDRKSVV